MSDYEEARQLLAKWHEAYMNHTKGAKKALHNLGLAMSRVGPSTDLVALPRRAVEFVKGTCFMCGAVSPFGTGYWCSADCVDRARALVGVTEADDTRLHPPGERTGVPAVNVGSAGKVNPSGSVSSVDVSHAVKPETLRTHWLAGIECDHDAKLDKASCACSLVDLGWQPNVGEAVESWIQHVVSVDGAGADE